MYANALKLTQYFNESESPNEARSFAAYALGIRLASEIPLPEKQTGGVTLTALDDYILPLVKETLSDVNEQVVLDTTCTLDVVRAITTYRYYTAYPQLSKTDLNEGHGLTAMLFAPRGALQYTEQAFPTLEEMTQAIQGNAALFGDVNRLVNRLVDEIKAA